MCGRAGVLVAVLVAGCATATDDSKSLQSLLERESPALATTDVSHPTGLFELRVPGRLVDSFTDSEHSSYAQFEIGAVSPAVCHFFFDRIDLAATLVASTDVILDQIAVASGATVGRVIEQIDTGAVGGNAFLRLDWLFWTEAGGGELKQRAASTGRRSVYCAHDSPGYHATFERFFAALVDSLEFPGTTQPAPFYREISVTSFGGTRIGVTERFFERDATGGIRAETVSSTLTPKSSEAVTANDSYEVEWSDANGALLRALYSGVDGDAQTELELQRASAQTWSVEGQFRSRPVANDFGANGQLASSYGQYRVYSALAAGTKEFSIERWLPVAVPNAATSFSFVRGDSGGPDRIPVRARIGPLVVDLELDSHGRVLLALVKTEAGELRGEIVYSDGAF